MQKGRLNALENDPAKVCDFFHSSVYLDVSADVFQVQTLNEQEWERLQQAHVLANVQQAFGTGTLDQQLPSSSAVAADRAAAGLPAPSAVGIVPVPHPMASAMVGGAPGPGGMSQPSAAPGAFPPDLLSPAVAPDAQTLAAALQEQLDLINREIR